MRTMRVSAVFAMLAAAACGGSPVAPGQSSSSPATTATTPAAASCSAAAPLPGQTVRTERVAWRLEPGVPLVVDNRTTSLAGVATADVSWQDPSARVQLEVGNSAGLGPLPELGPVLAQALPAAGALTTHVCWETPAARALQTRVRATLIAGAAQTIVLVVTTPTL